MKFNRSKIKLFFLPEFVSLKKKVTIRGESDGDQWPITSLDLVQKA